MGLTTAKIDRLLQRNETALQRHGYVPDLAIETLPPRQASAIRKLLQQCEDLQALQSRGGQQDIYGIERWQNDFVLLRDVESLPNGRSSGGKLRAEVWAALPNCLFKRFQQLFCDPPDYIVPPFRLNEEGQVRFSKRVDFDRIGLKGCLVAPDRVPDKLAVDLGLADFSAEKRDPLARLRKKADPHFILRLKLLWEAALPLQQGSQRLLRIAAPGDALKLAYPGIEGPAADLHGTILYSRQESTGKTQALVVGHYREAPAAQRKTFYEARGYFREIRALTEMREELESLKGELDCGWRAETSQVEKDLLREQANTLLTKAAQQLRLCQNTYKVDAKKILESIADLTDKRGRTNVSASMGRMVAAINRFEERFQEMYRKGGYNEQDQLALETALKAQRVIMRGFAINLRQNATLLDGDLKLFSDCPLTPVEVTGESRRLRFDLALRAHDLGRVMLRPDRTFAERLIRELGELDQALRARDRSRAKECAVRMNVIAKLYEVQYCFDRVQLFLAADDRMPLSRLQDFVIGVSSVYENRQLFPEIALGAAYQAPFEELHSGLKGLLERLKTHDKSDVGPRTELCKELRAYLGRFDIQGLCRALPDRAARLD